MTVIILAGCEQSAREDESLFEDGEIIQIEKSVLHDKVKGGWVGQLIGCTYGGPTEFKWQGAMIHDMVPIPWDEYQHERVNISQASEISTAKGQVKIIMN